MGIPRQQRKWRVTAIKMSWFTPTFFFLCFVRVRSLFLRRLWLVLFFSFAICCTHTIIGITIVLGNGVMKRISATRLSRTFCIRGFRLGLHGLRDSACWPHCQRLWSRSTLLTGNLTCHPTRSPPSSHHLATRARLMWHHAVRGCEFWGRSCGREFGFIGLR